jgi:hypothetical protein
VALISVSGEAIRGVRQTARMRAGAGLTCFAAGAVLLASSAAGATLRIENLSGSIQRLGSSRSGPLYEVRLRATVCARSSSDAQKMYPSEIRITHFAVSKSRSRWWAARIAIDHAPWLVPIGETWGGKACGTLVFEDPIPRQHYGVESLGNPRDCYGVALTIKAGGTQASRRAIVTCGRRFG